ncbi:MAG: adenylate/guanylate cyclase domain-containing protein [Desulfobulbaceae bacterium]|nr:MAG: adenylate/guanylate cyclase domain-containing protein [Desulfobulbaceae bacterium]
MICPDCRLELPQGSRFCKECGRKLNLVCFQCGTSLPSDSKFCLGCGQDLRQSQDFSKIDYQQPHSYTPKHLAEKILTSRSAIEGERKIVTILFADVAGSTAIFEKMDPEVVHEIMDGCFRIILDNIHHYEGSVNQFRGDGVMALFGAPIAHEDHAQRACHAALAIQKALGPYRQKLQQSRGIDFAMRIGLHSGPVVVAAIGDDLRMDYTAQGDTANLAARMEFSAEPGNILASQHTYKLSRDFFVYGPEELFQIKGKAEMIPAYRLIQAAEVQTRLGASNARGLTRFVGRGRELDTLNEVFATVQSGEGQVVGIVGEAGVGKSRLLLEFRKGLAPGEATFLEGHCLHYGGAMPYLPVLDVIRSFIGIKEGETEQAIQGKLRQRIIALDANLLHVVPPILELLSIEIEDETFAGIEPQQKRKMTFEAIRDLLIRASQDQPLILVVEDLHWIDRTTQELLEYMIHWLPRNKILLILLYRPEYTHPWGSKSYYRMIGLNQLSSSCSADLVDAILEGGDVVPELRELILSRTSGNPLFMEELTRSLLENGSIEMQENHFFLRRDISGIKVPDTIHGIIAARMDRLEDSLKRILQVASVIGREFAYRILETISGVKNGLKSQLVNLQGLEFIYEKGLFPELEYIFRHALVQEVAYNSLLVSRRKEIHEKISEAIEKLYPERLEEFCEVVGYHYSLSGNMAKAYEYLKRSAKKAIRNNSLLEGIQFYKQAADILSKLSQTDKNKRELINLILSMRGPMARIGDAVDYLPLLLTAEKLADEMQEITKMLQIRSALGVYYIYRGGNPQLGWKYLEDCLEQEDIIQDVTLMIPIGFDLCTSSLLSGDWQRVNHIAPLMISLIERSRLQNQFYDRNMSVYVCIIAHLAISTTGCGDIAEGERLFAKAFAVAREIDNLASKAYVEWAYGIMLCFLDAKRAIGQMETAIKYLEESQNLLLQGVSWCWLGYVHCLTGDTRTGIDLTEKGLKMHTDLGVPYWQSFCHFFYSTAHFELGDTTMARTHAELALQCALKNNEKQVEGLSRAWLGRVLARIEPSQAEKAEEMLQQGIQQLEDLEILTQAAMCYMWLGETKIEAGRREEACQILKKAESMFQKAGMVHWLSKAKIALNKVEK